MIIKIKEPFWTAGRKYNWVKDGFDCTGIGLKASDLKGNESITVEVQNKTFSLNCAVAIEFIRKYTSIFVAGQTKLGVVSKTLLIPA